MQCALIYFVAGFLLVSVLADDCTKTYKIHTIAPDSEEKINCLHEHGKIGEQAKRVKDSYYVCLKDDDAGKSGKIVTLQATESTEVTIKAASEDEGRNPKGQWCIEWIEGDPQHRLKLKLKSTGTYLAMLNNKLSLEESKTGRQQQWMLRPNRNGRSISRSIFETDYINGKSTVELVNSVSAFEHLILDEKGTGVEFSITHWKEGRWTISLNE